MNQWGRRSLSRDRGGPGGGGGGRGGGMMGGGNRFDRRSPQRRFSRERRSSPRQYRNFSPQKRYSPQRPSRDRRNNSIERRPLSPVRVSPQPNKRRSKSTSTNWEEDGQSDEAKIPATVFGRTIDSRLSPRKPVISKREKREEKREEKRRRESNKSRGESTGMIKRKEAYCEI